MRKILIAALAALTALGVVAVAAAQEQKASLEVTVSPKKAGKKKKPRSTNLTFKVVNQNPNATLTHLDILLPATLKASGKGFPACNQAALEQQGKSVCPPKSRVGQGTASAVLGVNNPPEKARTPLTFKITAFVTGAKKIAFYLESNELENLKIVSPGTLSKGGRKLTVRVPEAAQSPDGVTFAGLQDIVAVLGAKYKKRVLVGATGCRKGQHLLNTKLYFRNNGADPGGTATASDGAPCTK